MAGLFSCKHITNESLKVNSSSLIFAVFDWITCFDFYGEPQDVKKAINELIFFQFLYSDSLKAILFLAI